MSETLTFRFEFAGGESQTIELPLKNLSAGATPASNTITFNGASQQATNNPSAVMTNSSGSSAFLDVVVQMGTGYYTEIGGSAASWSGQAQSKLRSVIASNDSSTTTWGLGMNSGNPGLTSLDSGFEGCAGLTSVPSYLPVTVNTLRDCFKNATAFNSPIGAWDTTNVTNIQSIFENASAFNQDIGLWTMGSVTTMGSAFNGASAFNQNIRLWDTDIVTVFTNMFLGATQMNTTYAGVPGYGETPPALTQDFFKQEQLVITWTDVPNDITANVPLSGGSGLNSNIDVIRWNEGSALPIASNLSFTNTSGGLLTFTARITVQDGSYTTLGDTNTWSEFSSAGQYITSVQLLKENGGPTTSTTWALGMSGADPTLTNLRNGFANLTSLVEVPQYIPDTVTTLENTFLNCSLLNPTATAGINTWNTANVSTMSGTFQNAEAFDQALSSWNVTGVVNFSNMFNGATQFDKDISSWETSVAVNFNSMFKDASNFDQNIGSWTTTAVTDFSYMFQNASDFNNDNDSDPITDWNTGAVTNMIGMFNNAERFNRPIGGWNTGNVTDMSTMFDGATDFNKDIGNWNTINVTTMVSMFHDASNFNNESDTNVISDWNVSNVTDMTSIFENAVLFNRDIRFWDTGNVTSMVNMFKRALVFDKYIAIWNTSNVNDMTGMFQNASLFNQYINYNSTYWDVSNVTTMKDMFHGAGSFNQELKDWTVSNVTDMSGMFQEAGVFNKNIGVGSNWDVSNVTTMKNMFHDALLFNQNLNVWNVLKVLDMSSMFEGATDFNGNITYWTSPNVTDMSSMFSGASNFNQDIGNWKTQNVTSMYEMFKDAVVFDQYIRAWITIKVTNYTRMFLGATAMIASYTGTTGFGTTPIATFFNQRFPCFLGGTLIDTNKGLVPVEELRQGDMVKTIDDGYKPVEVIGTRMIPHFAMDERVKDQLYICRKERFPEATDDLIITGCHSILLFRDFHDEHERQRVIQVNGKAYVTNGILRFPACVLDRNGMYTTDVYPVKGTYNIYHFALEHEDYYMNYGIYANNILVESSSRRYMYEESNMYLIDYKVPEEQEEPTYIDTTIDYDHGRQITSKECNDIRIQI